MPLIQIKDIDDERIAVYRDLLSAKTSRRSGLFVVEGCLLVERLVESSFVTQSILLSENRLESLPISTDDHHVYVATRKLIETIVGYNFHRGALACGQRRRSPKIDDVLSAESCDSTVLVCVGIQDPTNLGSILRSAAAFGVSAVILGNQCSDPFSRRVLRVSMGASLKLPIVESNDLEADLAKLNCEFAFERVATVLDDAEVLEQAERPSRLAILIGNEAHGLPDTIVESCEHRVTIPMQLGTDSLNAAVATGIMLHHFTRKS